ncbi:MAG: hypothetical protein HY901_08285 [Deltaproteobacteria bacterium]|nr:hypothetical protein [Deltaproteobacteria bacterium]
MAWLTCTVVGLVLLVAFVLFLVRGARSAVAPLDPAMKAVLFSPAHLRELAACLARLKSEVLDARPLAQASGGEPGEGAETRAEAVSSQGVGVRYSVRREGFIFQHAITLAPGAEYSGHPEVTTGWMGLIRRVLGVEDALCSAEAGTVLLRMNEARQRAYAAAAPRLPAEGEEIDWSAIVENRLPSAEGRPPAPLQPGPAAVSRDELQQRLQQLADQPPPEALLATCYRVASPPARAEYVCPKCGARTLYVKGLAKTVEWDIPAARRLMSQIGGVSVELDESQFCKTCSPSAERPQLGLLIALKGEPAPRRVEPIESEDLEILRSFLQGEGFPRRPRRPGREESIARLQRLLALAKP